VEEKMAASKDTPPSREPDFTTDVAIIGAGPVGLTIANYLGQAGVKVLVIEQLDDLIDYPRAIGIDDESLRSIQAIGLVDKVLPHTTPFHWMRFLTPKGRCFASIEPRTDEFGWSRRNAFIQPQVDRVLYQGLNRFDNVTPLFLRELVAISPSQDDVTLNLTTPDGGDELVRASYVVGCDGGNSLVRRSMQVSFEGETAPNQWIVIDVANDPIGTPNVYLCADPIRPYVSAALPHAIRRFEFMVMPGETEEELRKPENLRKLLGKVVPNPEQVDVIRQRVYTHNARLAGKFRVDRCLLAGDAAHIMPVWQGQGYNSGIRDASNLGWKLAMVVNGLATPSLLGTYEIERRDHARAMIDLSVLAGKVLAPPKQWQAVLRDGVSWVLNYLPPIKRYFLEMRFKPMPRLTAGAVVAEQLQQPNWPIGRLFIQPKITSEDGTDLLLDEVIGPQFAIIAWGTNPLQGMSQQQQHTWRRLGCRFIQALPIVQMAGAPEVPDEVARVGDVSGRLKAWFSLYPASIVVLRPDRFIAAMATPQTIGQNSDALLRALSVASAESTTSADAPSSKVA
jgi:3-(3-hydroxy-phenyl)propionate hydroxylase